MIVNKIKDCRYYNQKFPYTVTDDIILKWLSYVLLTSYWKLFFMMLPAVYPTNTEGMWTDFEVESETNTRIGRVWIKQLFFLASAATFLFFPTLHLVTVHCFNAFYFPTGLKKVHDRELRIYWSQFFKKFTVLFVVVSIMNKNIIHELKYAYILYFWNLSNQNVWENFSY